MAPQRRLLVVVVAAVVAFAVVGVAGWMSRPDRDGDRAADRAAPDPGCGPVLRESAESAGAHLDGTISYPSAPPSFGDHNSRWEVRADPFYDVTDRPDVSVLVHNLEHGYNILWYDQTVIDDPGALDRLREIADGYASIGVRPDPATAFIAAPWTSDDGGSFPEGMHYALTHWYADSTDRTRSRADELGLTRYCADISAEIVQEWMDDYPLSAAPEGYPDLM